MTSSLLWTLIVIQIALGAFDTIYHHELTERLAWRPAQQRELRLHGMRNLLYAVLFVLLGWFEVHGIWAMLAVAVLVIEVFITLVDFVEEDLSCKLPASERVTHSLLALNYGGILALLLPVLTGWAQEPTALKPAYYGPLSMIALAAAGAVVLFGLRDFAAARRLGRLTAGKACDLVAMIPGRRHILVTGASGLIGRRLVEALTEAGHQVTVLLREPQKAALLRPPFRLVTSLAQIPDDAPIDSIINLAGEPIADGLWTRSKRRRILTSRVRMTRDVVRLIDRLDRRPKLLISGSAVGWYGSWRDEALTEFDGAKRCFTHRVCEAWERTAMRAERAGTRVVRLRIGIVFGTDGGLLGRLLPLFEFGLGGPLGTGAQWVSWIERDDLVRLIAHAIATPKFTGAVNATAPAPVTNAVLARELGRALHRPALIRLPATLLRGLAGSLAEELLLSGQRVLPDKAEVTGFKFDHESLQSALAAMLGGKPARRPRSGWTEVIGEVPALKADHKA